MLEQAIQEYKKVIDLPDLPKELALKVGKRATDRMQFRGWTAQGVRTMQKLLDMYPEEYKLNNDLGVQYLILNKMTEAKQAFHQVLDKDPTNGIALVHYGFILKTHGNDMDSSIPYLQRGIDTGDEGTVDGRFFFHLGDAYFRKGEHNKSLEVYEKGASLGLFMSKYQRSLYNVNGLTGRPWWNQQQTGQAKLFKLLETNWKKIRDEALAQMNAETGTFIPEEENLREKGDWKQFTLYSRGRKHASACAKTPITCGLIDKYPEAATCKRGQVKFSVMQPGVHVWPHTGPTNCRLRAHLGLVVPDGPKLRVAEEIKTWDEGKVIIFDDSFEHEVWHDGQSVRMVLIVDIWHPELSARDKATLSPI
jgi:aspartate beta-hydroxylase